MLRNLLSALLIASALAASACSDGDGDAPPGCISNNQCPEGSFCVDRKCQRPKTDAGGGGDEDATAMDPDADISTPDSGAMDALPAPDAITFPDATPDPDATPSDPDATAMDPDATTPMDDAGTPVTDGGTPVTDGGTPVTDGGTPVVDGGTPVTDGGTPVVDGSTPVADGGTPVADGGVVVGCGMLIEAETAAMQGTNDEIDTAEGLASSTGTFNGELQSETDVDFYSFDIATPGTRMRITVNAGTSPADMVFGVHTPDGALVRIGGDPLTNNGSREVFFTQAGTHYLQIAAVAPPVGNHCYNVTMTALAAPVPTALALPAANTSQTVMFTVGATEELAYYRMNTGSGDFRTTYVFNLAAVPATQAAGQPVRFPDVDTIVTVWDPNRLQVVAESDDAPGGSNSNTFATLTSTASKDYWVIIDHFLLRNSDSGEMPPASGLQSDVTLTVDNPAPVTLPFNTSGTLTADRSIRWYLLTENPGHELTASLDGTAGALADVVVAVADSDGYIVAQDAPGGGTAALANIPTFSDRTLIAVASFDNLFQPAGSGAYTVDVSSSVGCTPVTGGVAPAAGAIAINEVLWDPANGAAGDANGDGVRNDQDDELVEIVNTSATMLDMGGVQVADVFGGTAGVRFTFPCQTLIQPSRAVVIFGGGAPTGTFGGAGIGTSNMTLTCAGSAPARSLCLNNSASEAVSLRSSAGVEITRFAFTGLTASPDASYVHCTSGTPANAAACDQGASFVRHNTIPGVTAQYSPGTKVDGATFTLAGDVCDGPTSITMTGTLNGESTLGFVNDYQPDATACGSGYEQPGPDHVYSITVPTGQQLTVTMQPDPTFDLSLYLIAGPAANCAVAPLGCLAGIDDGFTGQAETLTHRNTSGAAEVVFIVVDGYLTTGGTYSLTTAIAP